MALSKDHIVHQVDGIVGFGRGKGSLALKPLTALPSSNTKGPPMGSLLTWVGSTLVSSIVRSEGTIAFFPRLIYSQDVLLVLAAEGDKVLVSSGEFLYLELRSV